MSLKYLIINTGSASKKYSFYEDEQKIYTAHFEHEESNFVVTEKFKTQVLKTIIDEEQYKRAVEFIIQSLISNHLITNRLEINLSGIRIVAPGEYFLNNKFIEAEYLQMAQQALSKVPLHLAPALKEIESVRLSLGENHPLVGVSDSAYHATIAEEFKLYGLPIKDSRALGLYRFGYHGISVQSVVAKAGEILGKLPSRVIVCHLGGGASVTAVKDGQSLNTTMGFTPLEGLIMATRVGDIDAGATLYLMDKLKKDTKEMGAYFNNQCGLLGLSGQSNDIRELLKNEQTGDKNSHLALKIYVNKIKQSIGQMAAILGGIDLLILAGTVGERSFIMRERICTGLEFLGLYLDKAENNKSEGVEVLLNEASSPAKILVVKTDEMEEIAKVTLQLAKKHFSSII